MDEPLTVCVSASDDISVVSVSLWVDGLLEPLDQRECALVTPTQLGTAILDGEARDANDNVGSDQVELSVVDCSSPQGPVVVLSSPLDGSRWGAPTDVVATATPQAASTERRSSRGSARCSHSVLAIQAAMTSRL